jgi:predicted transcriptional regulator
MDADLSLDCGDRGFVQNIYMSDKQLALESIQRMPDDATFDDIAERLKFLVGVQKGFDAAKRGETVPIEEVKPQLTTWLTK